MCTQQRGPFFGHQSKKTVGMSMYIFLTGVEVLDQKWVHNLEISITVLFLVAMTNCFPESIKLPFHKMGTKEPIQQRFP